MSNILHSPSLVILAILSLGFLIFIHELGHFLAAKRCGIRVEKFSIGFGPSILGFKRGETEYCLSLLPFGGFVKMAGENPEERSEDYVPEVTEENPTCEFHTAPVRHRIFVAIAGPAMNVIFGFVVFSLVYIIGLDGKTVELAELFTGEPIGRVEQSAKIGLVADNGPASTSGIQPGDTIISINGDKVKGWFDFNTRILSSPDKELEFVISRDGVRETLYVTPEIHNRKGMGQVGVIKVASRQDVMVTGVEGGSPADLAGVQVGDIIQTINDEEIYHLPVFGIWPISDWLQEAYHDLYAKIKAREEIKLGIKRGTESLTFSMPVNWTVIALVKEESAAEQAGIRLGDRIVGINGESIENFELYPKLYQLTESNPNQTIELTLLRNGEQQAVQLIPEIVKDSSQLDLKGLHWETWLSGLQLHLPPVPIPKYSVIGGIGQGLTTNWLILKNVAKTLQRLVTRQIPTKFLSGPIGIVDITRRVMKVGLISSLFFVGFISVNLAIVNLLPIPIADGGQILFFTLEKLRGRPLSLRKQIIIQQVSMVLIIGLFLYITWFDIRRLY